MSTFSFKKFTLHQDRCAMKVGTDGTLLGAWARVGEARRILDVGTGCGLIALMAAQRADAAVVTGIDVDADASAQARENVAISPWPDRVKIETVALQDFRADAPFDAILSNPPFFTEALLCPDRRRTLARHANSLMYNELAGGVARLLSPDGEFSVVLPFAVADDFVQLCWEHDFYLARRTAVQTLPHKVPKRVLLAFRRTACTPEIDTLCIENADHTFSAEYRALTRDFYLKF